VRTPSNGAPSAKRVLAVTVVLFCDRLDLEPNGSGQAPGWKQPVIASAHSDGQMMQAAPGPKRT
jgi:hypothetical protein